MIKKTPKLLVGFLTICIIWCSSFCVPVFADTPNKLIDSAIIQSSNGVISVVSQSSRSIWLISVENFDGTVSKNKLSDNFESTTFGPSVLMRSLIMI